MQKPLNIHLKLYRNYVVYRDPEIFEGLQSNFKQDKNLKSFFIQSLKSLTVYTVEIFVKKKSILTLLNS